MIKAIVLSPWAGSGTEEDPFTSQINYEYRDQLLGIRDVTGQEGIPNPNMYCVQVVCDDAILDLIEGNPEYHVLSSEVYQ